ncbi:hypothetical protein BV882_38950 [Streptomyces sp. 46]|nr:hypothetical protein BV882_38950 [Streptomyces sp. 46]
MEYATGRKLYVVTQTTEAAAVQQPPKPTRVRVHRAWFVAAVTFVTIIGAAAFRSVPGLLIDPLHDEFVW